MTHRPDSSRRRRWRVLLAGTAAVVLVATTGPMSTAAAAPVTPPPVVPPFSGLPYHYKAAPLVSASGQTFYPSSTGNPISSGTDWIAGVVLTPNGQDSDQHAAVYYVGNRSIRQLRPPGSRWATATDINRLGQVTGTAHSGDREQAYVWSPDTNTYRMLGSLGGYFARPVALNDHGVVVGQSTNPAGADHAFVSDPAVDGGRMRDLGVRAGDVSSGATGVNNAGLVVGWSGTSPGGRGSAFEWSRTSPVLTDLGHPEDDNATWPTDVNDQGYVVGGTAYEVPANGTGQRRLSRGFVFSPYSRSYLVLPARTDQAVVANAINTWGVAVGTSTSTGQSDQALIWNACGQPGKVLFEDQYGTGAVGINRYEHVVGSASKTPTFWRRNEGACRLT